MKNKKLLWQLPFLTLLIVSTILIIRQQQAMPYQKSAGLVFGTSYHVSYQCDSDLSSGIMAELMKVDASLSPFNEKSVITAINQNKHVKPDAMFMAMCISRDTDGAFDITIAPLVNAWGFGFKNGIEPSRSQVDSLMQIVGYKKVALNGGYVQKQDPRMMLDCSAIAKGYGSDVIARLLRSRGITHCLVEIGGEIVASGINEHHEPWRIGVTKPTDDPLNSTQELQTTLRLTNKAMATSGNYRNFYYKGGKKYAHTIDPNSGYPVQHNILSATVIAEQCAVADAYATSFMVMGLDKAKEVLDRHPELMAYFIYSDKGGHDAVWFSPSLNDKIEE